MHSGALVIAALLAVGGAAAQPYLPGSGCTPLGNLATTDQGGPYSLEYFPTQVAEIKAGIAARKSYTAKDIFDFLTQVECLEGLFDTWGVFGRGFIGDLELGGPTPIGARKANLTERTRAYLAEVALQEQGHALLTRHLGSKLPCPVIDFDGGFNALLAAAYKLPEGTTVKDKFGAAFDPFKDDVSFTLAMLTLEELGATGNKGLAGLVVNPVHAAAISGLATSATAQSTIQRVLLYEMRNEIVFPFKETAQQVFARVSAYRDANDGPQFDDQGIVNTDPRTIAVPFGFSNLVPTDVHGITFARTPAMNIRILTVAAPDSKGAFFPKGLGGKINSWKGYNQLADGFAPCKRRLAPKQCKRSLGPIPGPVTAKGPSKVEGELQLTQSRAGHEETASAEYRGYKPVPSTMAFATSGPRVKVGKARSCK